MVNPNKKNGSRVLRQEKLKVGHNRELTLSNQGGQYLKDQIARIFEYSNAACANSVVGSDRKAMMADQAKIIRFARENGVPYILPYGMYEHRCFYLTLKQKNYEPFEYYAQDFSIAEFESVDCILETITRHTNNLRKNVKCFTELTLSLAWKVVECDQRSLNALADLYYRLYISTLRVGEETFRGEDWKYFSATMKRVLDIKVAKREMSLMGDAAIVYY